MPSALGGPFCQYGFGGILARPGAKRPGGIPPFRSAKGIGQYNITGISRDAQGNALPLCTVMLFQTGTDALVAKVVSEAVTGTFSFSVPNKTSLYYCVFYLAGSPDVAGTTVNTLVGS